MRFSLCRRPQPGEPIAVRIRQLAIVAVATAVGALGLTACTSKVGAAAIVNGDRISDNTVSRYVKAGGADPTAVQQAAAQGNELAPRAIVINTLVQNAVFTRALSATAGGLPSDATLASYHDDAVTNLAQGTPGTFDSQIDAQLPTDGLEPSFRPVFVRSLELEWALVLRSKATQPSQLAAYVNKNKISVQVSAKYGAWDPTSLTIGAPSTGIPSFVKVPSASASAPATAG
jgi:hypothetical protein